jgi:hypothetical protein
MEHGCQMVSFQTENPNLGKFWRPLDWKMLMYCMAIWNILQPFGIFYQYLVHFLLTWNIFSGFGIMHQEKSGNPAMGVRVRPIFYWASEQTAVMRKNNEV